MHSDCMIIAIIMIAFNIISMQSAKTEAMLRKTKWKKS